MCHFFEIGLSDDNVNQENEPISFQEACLIRVQLHREELEEKEEAMKKKFVQRIKAKDAELEEHKRKVKNISSAKKFWNSV